MTYRPTHPARPTRPAQVPALTTVTRRLAAVAVAVAGLLHVVLAPEYLSEAPMIGALFLLSAPLTAWATRRLWRADDRAGWLVGVAITAGMVVGFLASRTVGLLGYTSNDWAEGIPALAVEAAFIGLAASRLVGSTGRRR